MGATAAACRLLCRYLRDVVVGAPPSDNGAVLTLIQHPLYSDWGVPCPHCGSFVALADEPSAPLHGCCPSCGQQLCEPAPQLRLAPLRFTLSMPGEVRAIEPAREKMLAMLRQCTCSEEEILEVSLALQEALANAVVHGCDGKESRPVCCSVECDSQTVTITVEDPGRGFDAGAVRDCTSPEGLVSHHGRGIAIMRGLMDDVTFENRGSLVRMQKRFSQAEPRPATKKSTLQQ